MRSSVIGSRDVPSTTRRCRTIIGAKSRHLGLAVITSTPSATTRKDVTCATTPSAVHPRCSVWVGLSPLSSCVARVVTNELRRAAAFPTIRVHVRSSLTPVPRTSYPARDAIAARPDRVVAVRRPRRRVVHLPPGRRHRVDPRRPRAVLLAGGPAPRLAPGGRGFLASRGWGGGAFPFPAVWGGGAGS